MKYQQGYRRMLLDMHIPDWDPAFLSRYDPRALASMYERANVTGVMIYCKSHPGLCYWPTRNGKMHAGIGGRDVVGEMVGELRRRDIGVCAYYSIVFDNWAAETHPEWRQRTVQGFDIAHVARYGVCCQNHPDYRAYEMAQLDDLLSRYKFDALFLDMIFWPTICGCEHCGARFDRECGKRIPTTVDWTSPDWCAFQSARERWAGEFAAELFAKAKRVSPGIVVTHNLAPALANWVLAQPISACVHDTFLAGDLYGDRIEQLFVSKLLLHLSETRPAEFMTSVCSDLTDHVQLKSEERLKMAAAAASANSSAFLFIDAIDPIGTVNPQVYERVGRAFTQTEPYEPFLGGEPIEDVAIYFSGDSQMNFAENGKPSAEFLRSSHRYPHIESVRGACRALAGAHVPFGVITRRQLMELGRFRVIVLPDISRIDLEETRALRDYVRNGGRIYASRYTSLVDTSGKRQPDFVLADVFGANYDVEEAGSFVYLKPATPAVAEAISPQRFVSWKVVSDAMRPAAPLCVVPRLKEKLAGETLATLTLPYGYPSRGTVLDHKWASIHSSPPWVETSVPVIVANNFGGGRSIYSAFPIESVDGEAESALFVSLIRSLIGAHQSFGADAPRSLWMSAFDQRDRNRVMASFLNYQSDLPQAPVSARFWIRPPAATRFTSLRTALGGRDVSFTLDSDGTLRAERDHIETLAMVVAEYRS